MRTERYESLKSAFSLKFATKTIKKIILFNEGF